MWGKNSCLWTFLGLGTASKVSGLSGVDTAILPSFFSRCLRKKTKQKNVGSLYIMANKDLWSPKLTLGIFALATRSSRVALSSPLWRLRLTLFLISYLSLHPRSFSSKIWSPSPVSLPYSPPSGCGPVQSLEFSVTHIQTLICMCLAVWPRGRWLRPLKLGFLLILEKMTFTQKDGLEE